MSRKASGRWKRPKLEAAWRLPRRRPSLLQRAAQRLEAPELLRVEGRVFGEGHHHALDPHRAAGRQVTDERGGPGVGDAHPADSRVDANVKWYGPPGPLRDPVQHVSDRRVDHGRDVAGHRLFERGLVEGPHQQDRLLDPGLANGQGFGQLDHGEAGDRRQRFEQAGDVRDSQPVAVVLDDGEDRPRRHSPRDLVHVVAQVRGRHLDPRIEGRIGDRRRGDARPSGHGRGDSTCSEKGPA